MTTARTQARITDRLAYVRSAVIEYIAHGWGVLPGSIWDGRRFTLGHCATDVSGLVPVMLSGRTLRRAREAWSWWSIVPYSILARAGEDFDVITVPSTLVRAALAVDGSAMASCPTILAPRGARVLVRRGSRPRLRSELRAVEGCRCCRRGAVVALPPTLVPGGSLRWWIAPDDVGYQPGDSDEVQAALVAALTSWSGCEVS
jgi:hypothetical protein